VIDSALRNCAKQASIGTRDSATTLPISGCAIITKETFDRYPHIAVNEA
jgi:hypothetical protein